MGNEEGLREARKRDNFVGEFAIILNIDILNSSFSSPSSGRRGMGEDLVPLSPNRRMESLIINMFPVLYGILLS